MLDPGQISPPSGWPEVLEPYGQLASELAAFTVATVVVYVVGRLLVVPGVLRVVRSRNRNNPTLVTATETYLKALFVGLAVLLGLVAADQGRFLTNTDSAILVAALTFVFGVAGREVLGSLISGLFLVADPDFNVGDWISWPGGEGTVEAVDFRVTRIRTVDNETVTVPNTELTTNALTRPFGRERYRVTERAYVSYAEDTERALYELRSVAAVGDRVLEEPEPRARVLDLGPDSITVQAEFWIDDPGQGGIVDIRSDFRRRLKSRFDEVGLTLAPPSGRQLSGSVAVERRRAE
jgi:small-conductance mechanosensitive channel